jgi:hypothetical protein
LNSDQVQLKLNNGAVVDPDDRVCDVVDDREEVINSLILIFILQNFFLSYLLLLILINLFIHHIQQQ